MPEAVLLQPSETVHQIVHRLPGSAAVFHRFGIDTCCGGSVPLETAARSAGIELAEVLRALADARL